MSFVPLLLLSAIYLNPAFAADPGRLELFRDNAKQHCAGGNPEQEKFFKFSEISDADISRACAEMNKITITTQAMAEAGLKGSACDSQYKSARNSAIIYKLGVEDFCRSIENGFNQKISKMKGHFADGGPLSNLRGFELAAQLYIDAAVYNASAADFLERGRKQSATIAAINQAVADTAAAMAQQKTQSDNLTIAGGPPSRPPPPSIARVTAPQKKASSISESPKPPPSTQFTRPAPAPAQLAAEEPYKPAPSEVGKVFERVALPKILADQELSRRAAKSAISSQENLVDYHNNLAEEFRKSAEESLGKAKALGALDNGTSTISSKESNKFEPAEKNYFQLDPSALAAIIKATTAQVEKNSKIVAGSVKARDLSFKIAGEQGLNVDAGAGAIESLLGKENSGSVSERIAILREKIKKNPKDKSLRDQLQQELKKNLMAQLSASSQAKEEEEEKPSDAIMRDLGIKQPSMAEKEKILADESLRQRFFSDERLQGLNGEEYLSEMERELASEAAEQEDVQPAESPSLFIRITKKLVILGHASRLF